MTDETETEAETVDAGDVDVAQPYPGSMSEETYTPVFGPLVRTIIYITCLLASIVGTILLIWGASHNLTDLVLAGGIVDACAGLLSGAFDVAYNPARLSV